jgi:uncharacterized protein (TIGR03083 family)
LVAADSPWPTIHSERAALAEDLAGLQDSQWSTPSLCVPWTVREVLSHMTSTAKMTPPKFLFKFASSGFRFHAMNAREAAAESSGTSADVLAEFRAHVNDSSAPPGPVDSWLGETIVHAEDIRRPLGIAHEYPVEALTRVADFYKRSNTLIGAKSRIEGLALNATDSTWSTGSGPEVSGPLLSLVLAMTGRTGALSDLSGEGLTERSARTAPPGRST